MNQVAQRNYCAIKRVEFSCVCDGCEVIRKIEKTLSFELEGLQPYTDYHCFARVEHREMIGERPSEFSPQSEERQFQTREGSEFRIKLQEKNF